MAATAFDWSNMRGDTAQLLLCLLPVWCVGVFAGLVLPRPKWAENWKSAGLLLSTQPGTLLRQVAIAWHGALVVRECWYFFASPGSFRALCWAVFQWARGHGFSLPGWAASGKAAALEAESIKPHKHPELDWYVTEDDLNVFKAAIESDEPQAGYGRWEPMMEKVWDSATYRAWRRTGPSGKTEYKSVTVAADASAEEFMDFYLDDPTRQKWDGMIKQADSLEEGDGEHRLQVVLWRRSFPFSFISDREYVIARRLFREGPSLYAVTRAVEHDAAPRDSKVVRMDTFRSIWRSRTVPCPFGGAAPACETVLYHFEDFRINEGLARFAVKHGMAGFVKKMLPAVREFVEARRARGVGPFEADPAAYGVPAGKAGGALARGALKRAATAPGALAAGGGGLRHSPSSVSVASVAWSESGSSCDGGGALVSLRGGGGGERDGERPRRTRSDAGPLRRIGTLALAAGVAVAVGHTASTSAARRRPGHRRGSHAHGHGSGHRHQRA